MTNGDTFEVNWTRGASEDLIAIVTYVAQQSLENAALLIDRLEGRAAGLDSMPHRGRAVPELLQFGITRFLEIIEKPYRIIYRIDDQVVTVLAVLDGRRHLEDLLLERLMRHA